MNSKRFSELREKKGITQPQLADMLGMSIRAIAAWESGERKPPIDKLEWLADFYNVSTDYLLGRTNVPQVNVDFDSGDASPIYASEKGLPSEAPEQAAEKLKGPGRSPAQTSNRPGVDLSDPATEAKIESIVERLLDQRLGKRDNSGKP